MGKVRKNEGIAVVIQSYQLSEESKKSSAQEWYELIQAAGFTIFEKVIQLKSSTQQLSLGKGKLEQVKEICQSSGVEYIWINQEITGSQKKHLEKECSVKVIDRTELILHIFATRARHPKTKLRIELAQKKYELSRLTGMWSHFGKVSGGVKGNRGMGESQLEVDKRLHRKAIKEIEKKIEHFDNQKEQILRDRDYVYSVCLVGYTNAGKSTLLNGLTQENQAADQQVFLTLDAVRRKVKTDLPVPCILSDTVGFIKDLPKHIESSFHSTLHEIKYSHLILHVVDGSDPDFKAKKQCVEETMKKMGCFDNRPKVLILTRKDQGSCPYWDNQYEETLNIDGTNKEEQKKVLKVIEKYLHGQIFEIKRDIPQNRSDIIGKLSGKVKICQINPHAGKLSIVMQGHKHNQKQVEAILKDVSQNS